MSENHWKSFQSLPEDGIPIRAKESLAKTPILMVRHGKTLKYKIHAEDPWQDMGVCTEYVFSRCEWCYDSQYTPEPPQDNNPPIFSQDHFLKWVTIHRPQTYNELLREYHDFCKDNSEKANIRSLTMGTKWKCYSFSGDICLCDDPYKTTKYACIEYQDTVLAPSGNAATRLVLARISLFAKLNGWNYVAPYVFPVDLAANERAKKED